jgi:DNA polymerase I-like protein with 3'-5' exonuclease and polymerase domains
MNILILDVETTISNKGNPFDKRNKLVAIGLRWLHSKGSQICWEPEWLAHQMIDEADILVGFNIKFDLHWLRRVGINFEGKRIWDCQIGEFILENQHNPYPSLNQAAEKYGLGQKLDVIKTDYWDKGIDTDQIPREILSEYLTQDLVLTEKVFLKQQEQFDSLWKSKYQLFKLHCFDLLVLEEMEWNGIKFNTEKALKKADEIEEELNGILEDLTSFTNGVPVNLGSNDDVSCLLYGGTITIDSRIPVGVYKTGNRVGETRYKIISKEYELPRLIEPLKGTSTKLKEGQTEQDAKYWHVNDTVLRSLKATGKAKKVIALRNRYMELSKLQGTYLRGWSELIDKMGWEHDNGVGVIHGNLNQCVAVTGRLSSTKPNLQNADPETKTYCESRYETNSRSN